MSDIDADHWLNIPAEHAKNGKAHRVYLTPLARQQIEASSLLFRDVSPTTVQAAVASVAGSAWCCGALDAARFAPFVCFALRRPRRCTARHRQAAEPHDTGRRFAAGLPAVGMVRRAQASGDRSGGACCPRRQGEGMSKAPAKRPRKPYVPAVPAERIEAMIWALHGHIHAGEHEYEPLSHAAAREIMDLLYKVRDGKPQATRRPDSNARAAAVARDLMSALGVQRKDAIDAAYNEPNGDFRTLERRFVRAMAGFAKLANPPDSDMDELIRAACRTPAGAPRGRQSRQRRDS